jgi:hypothetical protein
VKNEEIKVTLNENYILILSKLVDENYTDIVSIIPKIKKTDLSENTVEPIPQSQGDGNSENFNKIFEKSEIAALIALSGFDETYEEKTSIQNVFINSLILEWVFGQNFDEH